MFLANLAVQLPLFLVPIWIEICAGQILFENNSRSPPGSSCMTPFRERGSCERLSNCQSLRQRINNWDELRPYMCGFAGTEPKVCCPSPLQPEVPAPPKDNSPPADIMSGTENRLLKPRPDSPKPPARGDEKPIFLPDDCGSSIFMYNRVIGGQKADKGAWPWMAVIFTVKRSGQKSAECGGSLVTARHVVTAAHCVVKRNTITLLDPKRLLVRLGVHDLSKDNDPGAIDVGVDDIRIHERYDPRVHTNDIAVIRLNQPVPFSDLLGPVCLPYDSLRYEDLSGKSSTVTGFGLTSVNGSSFSDVLMEVSFEIQDQEECRMLYEDDLPIIDGHLCAGTLDGSKDSCQGDSGGPLVSVGKEKRYYLVGIVSFGKKCALVGYPGVYTRVTEYLDWLTPLLAD